MEKCITDLLSAINNVNSHYIDIIGINISNEEFCQAGENAFTAELYHHYKSIIENDKTGYYKQLQLHYDLVKERFDGKRPDLVLHTSPNSRQDQRLYIEIKIGTRTTYYSNDLDKIMNAIAVDNNHNHLGYKYAVFITVKQKPNTGINSIRTYLTSSGQNVNPRLDDVFYINLDGNNRLLIKNFKDIL